MRRLVASFSGIYSTEYIYSTAPASFSDSDTIDSISSNCILSPASAELVHLDAGKGTWLWEPTLDKYLVVGDLEQLL